jgi:hypothetical protein
MSKQLLREFFELCEGGVCQDLLTEQEKVFVREGGLILSGIMQKADQENGNGRVYPRRILEREVDNYQKLVEERRALGELDHPDDSVINLKNTSHMVTKIFWEGNNVMGKVKVLDTPSGNILKNLVKGGVKLGISSRGLGSTRKEGGKTVVEEDFQLICFDFVQEPSTPGAFMGPKELAESRSRDINKIFSKADRLNRLLNDIIGK